MKKKTQIETFAAVVALICASILLTVIDHWFTFAQFFLSLVTLELYER